MQKNKGLKFPNLLDFTSFTISRNYILVGTQGNGVFRAKLSEITKIIEDKQLSENKLYPNPTSDFLNINSLNLIGKEIGIYDMLGNKLISVKAENPETRINVESLPVGVYLIRFDNQAKVFVKN